LSVADGLPAAYGNIAALIFASQVCPAIFFVTSSRGFDYSQGYHRLWPPDCPDWKKAEQCAERRGEPSRGFGGV
jgi:hypothetical protein